MSWISNIVHDLFIHHEKNILISTFQIGRLGKPAKYFVLLGIWRHDGITKRVPL